MSDWVRDDSGLTVADIERRQAYKLEGHTFVQPRRMGKPLCKRCGLVLLRNPLTAWCDDKGCHFSDHPGYRAAVARLGKREAS
jgi:hypothetical protein